MKTIALAVASATFLAVTSPAALAQDSMSFFVTSVGLGDGANLGGLEGADAHCLKLAEAAGVSGKEWRAYLSAEGVNAKDRIGAGPWSNVKGDVIATDVAALHSPQINLTKEIALSEKGEMINGRGDTPNTHDILTGANPDGTLAAGKTCGDWTSNGDGVAIVGHSDRTGLDDSEAARSWNSSHETRGGCGQAALQGTGGAGLFYCFAAN
ncbi:hypothetical protein [Paradevosia shaoguanensis]|uniref:Lectin n=1 Tax=Paradevosia shaoguanensis TaxID=1335043 RepID=A0AA41QMT5_9HYPH|nr:hypothetical protein [Paradevosia shaoguanensis]MCF1742932.1 hypothetical protein [Paradevosia shaoguanensis]MCI0127415.1 hypothetical protein [Paradevosia shaoguanensis]